MSESGGEVSRYISVEDVRFRINEVCDILDITRPEEIIYKDIGWYMSRPRLKKDGRTLLIYKCETEGDINFQLWLIFSPVVTRRSTRWIVRHMDKVLYPLFFLTIPNWILVSALLSNDFGIGLLYSLLLQIIFVSLSLPFTRISKERGELWAGEMMKIGVWSEIEAEERIKGSQRYPIILYIGGALIALMLGIFQILYLP